MLPTNLPSQTIQPYSFSNVNTLGAIGKGVANFAAKKGQRMDNLKKYTELKAKEHLRARRVISHLSNSQFPSSSLEDSPSRVASQEAGMWLKERLSSQPIKSRTASAISANPMARKGRRVEAAAGSPTRQVQGTGQPVGPKTSPVRPNNSTSAAKPVRSVNPKKF
jgi:hypothetical protein